MNFTKIDIFLATALDTNADFYETNVRFDETKLDESEIEEFQLIGNGQFRHGRLSKNQIEQLSNKDYVVKLSFPQKSRMN